MVHPRGRRGRARDVPPLFSHPRETNAGQLGRRRAAGLPPGRRQASRAAAKIARSRGARSAWCSSTSTSWPHMTALENVIEAPFRVHAATPRTRDRRGEALLDAGRARGQGRRLSGAALGWPAAARRDRAGAGDGAEAHAVRRADLRARSGARRRSARGDARPRRRRHDDGRRHARDRFRAQVGDHVVFMDDGVVVETGDPKMCRSTRATSGRSRSSPRCCSPQSARAAAVSDLEVADELLAVAHEHSVLERARRDAALHALDERAVLLSDLVVEGEEVVDPRLSTSGPKK